MSSPDSQFATEEVSLQKLKSIPTIWKIIRCERMWKIRKKSTSRLGPGVSSQEHHWAERHCTFLRRGRSREPLLSHTRSVAKVPDISNSRSLRFPRVYLITNIFWLTFGVSKKNEEKQNRTILVNRDRNLKRLSLCLNIRTNAQESTHPAVLSFPLYFCSLSPAIICGL